MKRVILFVALLLLFSPFVLASNCPPSLPKTYFGEVSYAGELLVGNYEIRAVMGEDTVGIGEVLAGIYEIDVSPCAGTTGAVYFYINGIGTNENGDYLGINDWGINENLNLTTLSQPPFNETCGDGAIQLGEECDGINLAGRDENDCGSGWIGTISCSTNCQIDYSYCSIEITGDSGGNSGGSSSGGGSGGGGGSSSLSSTPNNEGVIVLNEQKESENKEIGNLNSSEKEIKKTDEQTTGTFLGAVVGFIKSEKRIGIIFAIGILVMGIVVFIVRKKK